MSPAETSLRKCGSIRIDSERELALCEHGTGERQTVEIALVQPVVDADVLLVHAGTAISNLGPGSDRNTPDESRLRRITGR